MFLKRCFSKPYQISIIYFSLNEIYKFGKSNILKVNLKCNLTFLCILINADNALHDYYLTEAILIAIIILKNNINANLKSIEIVLSL